MTDDVRGSSKIKCVAMPVLRKKCQKLEHQYLVDDEGTGSPKNKRVWRISRSIVFFLYKRHVLCGATLLSMYTQLRQPKLYNTSRNMDTNSKPKMSKEDEKRFREIIARTLERYRAIQAQKKNEAQPKKSDRTCNADVEVANASVSGDASASESEGESESDLLEEDEDDKKPLSRYSLKKVSTFPFKLHEMLEDEKNAKALVWNDCGKSFRVHNHELLSKILPKYFKHSSFKSFLRQLYCWGFKKINTVTERGSYKNQVR